MNDFNKEQFSGEADTPTITDHIQKYLRNYVLFVIALAISLGLAFLYIRYTIPKYKVNAQMLVKTGNSATAGGSTDLIETALKGGNVNLENELQLLHSVELMERVVLKNAFNITYYKVGKVLDVDVYLDVPFKLVPNSGKDSNQVLDVSIKDLSRTGGMVAKTGSNQKFSKFDWSTPFTLDNQTFRLVQSARLPSGTTTYRAVWNPVKAAATDLHGQLYVGMLDNKTSIIDLSILVENQEKGKDLLNSVCQEYILANMEEKGRLADATIQFIDDRLSVVSGDLGGVEGNLASFQSANRMTSVDQLSSAAFANSNEAVKELIDLNNQRGVVDMIARYISNPTYRDKLVPSTLGLNDGTLTSMIGRYNELQIRKEKEAPYLQEQNEIMKDINNQINGVRVSIAESLKNIGENLKFRESGLRQQNSRYQQTLTVLPQKDRTMQDIKRKQSITEGLYLYLLQKREEFAISSASVNKPGYKQLDSAKGFGAVEPNTKKIWIMSVLAGLLIPVLIINARGMLNDKISGKGEIIARTPLPILGEISHVSKESLPGLLLLSRDAAGEQFRILRTRLSFLQQKTERKVLLVTSTQSNEGKSFTSLHLAGVLAIPGKKVALLNFDMRKVSDVSSRENLSDFISGTNTNLEYFYTRDNEIPSLHIYTARVISGNPSDLLLHSRMQNLFNELRATYDYIIVDTAPMGLVSDAYILGKYSDSILYVVRQGITPKKKIGFINDVAKTSGLPEILLVLNDIKTTGKESYKGYFTDYTATGMSKATKKYFWQKSTTT